MTVEISTTKVIALGNDAATVFSFSPLVIFETSDLLVTHVAADGTETVLSEGTAAANYSVTLSQSPGTGSITYPASGAAKLPTGAKLVMKRQLPIEQKVNLENQGGYYPDTQEEALDRAAMVDLQQQEEIDRCVKVGIGSSTDPDALVAELQQIGVDAAAALTGAEAAQSAAESAATAAEAAAAQLPLNKFDATAAPTVNDDSADGYVVGSRWVDVTHDEAYICVDATAGAARWLNSTLTLDELGTLAVNNLVTIALMADAAKAFDIPFEAGYDTEYVKEDLAVSTALRKVVVTRAMTIEGEAGVVETAPTGAALIVDILKNGVSIYGTKPQFAIGATTITAGVLNTTAVAANDVLTFAITQVGSTVKGQGLLFTLKGRLA